MIWYTHSTANTLTAETRPVRHRVVFILAMMTVQKRIKQSGNTYEALQHGRSRDVLYFLLCIVLLPVLRSLIFLPLTGRPLVLHQSVISVSRSMAPNGMRAMSLFCFFALLNVTLFCGRVFGLASTDTITWGGDISRTGYQHNHNMDPAVVGSSQFGLPYRVALPRRLPRLPRAAIPSNTFLYSERRKSVPFRCDN